MAKLNYKIKTGQKIFVRGIGRISNENLTSKLAEKLLSTGQFDNIIEVIKPKKKENEDETQNEQTTDNA